MKRQLILSLKNQKMIIQRLLSQLKKFTSKPTISASKSHIGIKIQITLYSNTFQWQRDHLRTLEMNSSIKNNLRVALESKDLWVLPQRKDH